MTNEKVLKQVLSGDRTNTKTKRKGIEVMWEEMKGRLLIKGDCNGKQCCINGCSIFDGVYCASFDIYGAEYLFIWCIVWQTLQNVMCYCVANKHSQRFANFANYFTYTQYIHLYLHRQS